MGVQRGVGLMKKSRIYSEYEESDSKDIYSEDYLDELEEEDVITGADQGFMEGYLEA